MRAADLYYGKIVYLDESGMSLKKVKIVRTGISDNYSGRADSSEVVYMTELEDGTLQPRVVDDTEYNRKYNADKIGQPLSRVVKNRKLTDLLEGDERMRRWRESIQQQQEIQETMNRARSEMTALLVAHGIPEEDINVHARYDADAKAAQVKSVRISGESIERLIQVFRDFKAQEKEEG